MNHDVPDPDPKTPEEVLLELVARRARPEAAGAPRVTLHLGSGHALSGRVLTVGPLQARGDRAVVLESYERDPRTKDPALVYLSTSVVAAVTVHDTATLLCRAATPSRLELRRRLEAMASSLSHLVDFGPPLVLEADWGSVDESEDSRRALSRGLDDVEAAVREVAGDEMGLRALRHSLRRVVLRIGPQASARLQGDTFTVTTSLAGPSDRRALKTALEAGL